MMDIERSKGLVIQVVGEVVGEAYRLAAEISFDGVFFSRLTRDSNNDYELVIFNDASGQDIKVDVNALIATLENAKRAIAD